MVTHRALPWPFSTQGELPGGSEETLPTVFSERKRLFVAVRCKKTSQNVCQGVLKPLSEFGPEQARRAAPVREFTPAVGMRQWGGYMMTLRRLL
jgi:hypothetical protein